MRILVSGGAGYIGSHFVRLAVANGMKVTVIDNLSRGHRKSVDPKANFIQGNIGDLELVTKVFRDQSIEAVVHFAAFAEVGESVLNPELYFQNNAANSAVLLEGMKLANVKKLVFSSTAAVYGEPELSPITEAAKKFPTNPYGESKLRTENDIFAAREEQGLGSIILRYFNVAGADPDGALGEDHRPESHLIPKVLMAARSEEKSVSIFGTDYPTRDGTCVRDYVHVMDLAKAHLLALAQTQPGDSAVYNLGSEKGFSVREVIAACERVTGVQLRVRDEARRPGDPATLIADSTMARKILKWHPEFPDIESAILHAWRWHSTRPNGYG